MQIYSPTNWQEVSRLLPQLKPQKVDWFGIKLIAEKTTTRHFKNEIPEENNTKWDLGARVEVLVNGQFGYAGTTHISRDGLQEALNKATVLAQAASEYRIHPFTLEQRPLSQGQYKSPIQKSLDSLSLKEMIDVLLDGSKALRVSDKIVARMAQMMLVETSIYSLCSRGQEHLQDFSIVNLNFAATASSEKDTQTRSLNGQHALGYQIGSEVFSRHRLVPNCQKVGEQALELLEAEDCPQQIADLILAPDQMMLQIHESIGHPLEIDRILGDERNYAGWSFVKAEDFGQLQYGSPLMNIVFDPTRFGEIASYGFDESGLTAKKEYLIREGRLLRGLGGLESQSRSGLLGVANFRSSSWNRPPIDRMANINLEPGNTSLEEMIQKTERGIIMHSNRSWSIDDYRNKFQFGCEYGQWIENGKITRTVKNPNYRGVTVPFWTNLADVGPEAETFGTAWCGKGEPNQVIRVGHASPYCRFKNIEVFGGQ